MSTARFRPIACGSLEGCSLMVWQEIAPIRPQLGGIWACRRKNGSCCWHRKSFPGFPRQSRLFLNPRDVPMDVYRGIARQIGVTNVRFFDDNVNELLMACDVLISGSSTTVLEAILLGRKAICVNFSDEPDRYPYVADRGALGARSVQEIRAALNQLFSAEYQPEWEVQRQRFLQRHAGPAAEGRAAQTLVERVVSLCSDTSLPNGSPAACV